MTRATLFLLAGLGAACDDPQPPTPEPTPETETETENQVVGGRPFLPGDTVIPCPNMPAAPLPDPGLPWDDVESFCADTDRGSPWTEATPPSGEGPALNAYADTVHAFMWDRTYRELGWRRDARWRLSGNYVGCPDDGGSYKGTHLLVRVYYSPEVVDWMCENRRTDPGKADPSELPDGAVIIKEMHSIDDAAKAALRVVEGTDSTLWIDADFDEDLTWLYMIKGEGAFDGWFWGEQHSPPADRADYRNLPIFDKTGFARDTPPSPADDGWAAFVEQVDQRGQWLPTSTPNGTVPYPSEGYGNYCIRCHASAESESTFSAIRNILGQEAGYPVLQPSDTPLPVDPNEHLRASADEQNTLCNEKSGRDVGCFPAPLPDEAPQDGFEDYFPQFAGTRLADVWEDRLPGQTWDHVPSDHGGPDGFVTSDQCIVCHDSNGAGNMRLTVGPEDNADEQYQLSLTPWAEWSSSPMGLAGRDPIFYAQLESEKNRLHAEGADDLTGCVENLCLHCHGVMGQRQHLADHPQPSAADKCKDVLPTPEMVETTFGGELFTRDMALAWPGEDTAEESEYAGLARDGISCAVCHRMLPDDLGEENSFTGNFQVGDPDTIYGPFDTVLEAPMQNSLGMTPRVGEVIQTSEMCGSCHTVLLPVLDNAGKLRDPEPYAFEQATYLEWLNSVYTDGGEDSQSCQDCHMPHTFTNPDRTEVELDFWIANIQDATYPASEHSLQEELELTERTGYRRHTLYGLNLFVNAYFQQFPLLLGTRQVPPTSSSALPPLLTAMDEAVKFARFETADVSISALERAGEELSFSVTVANKAGHNLPSGVGFRRLFVEVIVYDTAGEMLWASGRTNNLGVILDGQTDTPLPTERFTGGAYQEHHTTITSGGQVQIYEELNRDSDGAFTTSFVHRYDEIKDNRLRPRGWRYDHKYADEIAPKGVSGDPDYGDPAQPAEALSGADTTAYRIALPADKLASVGRVTARLYSQSTPPAFLDQRFSWAEKGPEQKDTRRLYYMAAHLNTEARTDYTEAPLAGSYIDDWRLLIASAEATAP